MSLTRFAKNSMIMTPPRIEEGTGRELAGSQREKEEPMEFVWFILIGLAAGWLAGQFMKGGGFGVVGDIVVGVVGALLGGVLFGALGLSAGGGLFGGLIVATIGAVVLLFLLRLIKRA
jgi:uncharacterized membrane protein YeaQ/YmgE (transglycosylase-associated protein family)